MDALRVAKVDNVILETPTPSSSSGTGQSTAGPSKHRLTGTLHLTPHHLIFSPDSTGVDATPSSTSISSLTHPSGSSARSNEIWVPYPSITLLTRLPQSIQGLYPLQIRTRNFESYVLLFARDKDGAAEDVWQSVKDCAVATSVEQLYAFFYSLPTSPSSSKLKGIEPFPSSTSSSSPLSASPEKASPVAALRPPSPSPSGWSVYNPRTEFARQGVGSKTKAWRFTDINKDYQFSPTYPGKLVVPSRIGDATLQYAAKYRSKARIPALTYLHWANMASITRSSQPMVGLKNARSAQDERLVECIFSSHSAPEAAFTNPLSTSQSPPSSQQPHVYGSTSTNLIIDARPTTNAMANVAMGAGTENMENYKFGKKAYLGIDNIHVMRKSLHTIIQAITEAEANPTGSLDRGLLRKSNWLRHVSTILDGALVIVRNIHLNASHVLIHCSDGWDRTAQLAAVAQICLDPFFRTIDGFKVLVEKDWLSFGHKFLDRSGHLSSEKLFTVTDADDDSDEEGGGGGGGAQRAAQAFFASVQKQFSSSNSHQKEISPVFSQFLDCVRQIQRQFPDRFEFNEQWLLDLHYHLYSCQFGTFLFNNERERRTPPNGSTTAKPYVERTTSAWDFFDLDRAKYLNESYNPSLDARESRAPDADQGVLFPDAKDVKFWFRLFRRGDEEMNGSKVALMGQAQGADMVVVTAGQVDPVSVEGAKEMVEGALPAPLQLPYQARSRSRGPSPVPNPEITPSNSTSDYLIVEPQSANVRNDTTHSTMPTNARTASPAPPPSLQTPGSSTARPKVPTQYSATSSSTASSSGSGWNMNWSQLSSGAISALSAAGNQIKTISSEAMAQMRAEAEEVGGGSPSESWRGGGPGESGRMRAERLPRTVVRVPSEANPWSTSASTPKTDGQNGPSNRDGTALSASISAGGASMPSSSIRPDPPQSSSASQSLSGAQRTPQYANSSSNPWAERPTPNLSSLTLNSGSSQERPPIRETTVGTETTNGPSIGVGNGTKNNPNNGSRSATDDGELQAALGGDRKAWDPLGAL